jgi:hypothetical protein
MLFHVLYHHLLATTGPQQGRNGSQAIYNNAGTSPRLLPLTTARRGPRTIAGTAAGDRWLLYGVVGRDGGVGVAEETCEALFGSRRMACKVSAAGSP